MTATHLRLAFALLLSPTLADAQAGGGDRDVHLSLGPGILTTGAYFTGPGDLELGSRTAAVGMVQAGLAVHPRLEILIAAAYARPEWELTGVPLAGTVGLSGATLWFADLGIRGWAPLGTSSGAPAVFAQLGGGLARYALDTSVLGVAVDERATNFALVVGAGLGVPVAGRLGIELMLKDYVASFRSVRDLAAFGVEGRRAHTVVAALNARLGL
jgi:hypothetical protein